MSDFYTTQNPIGTVKKFRINEVKLKFNYFFLEIILRQ